MGVDSICPLLRSKDLKKSHHQRVSELQRLRSIFGTSERQWVEAQVENAKQQAVLMTLKSQITSDEAHIHHDLHTLSGGRIIIFTEKRESVNELAGLLNGAWALHGDIQQSQHEVSLAGFRSV